MKKSTVLFSGLLIFLLVFSLLPATVQAAGRSEGGDQTTQRSRTNDGLTIGGTNSDTVNCDRSELATRADRIKCRLQHRDSQIADTPESDVPEACRRLATATDVATADKITKQGCRQLYSVVHECYDMQDSEAKRACLAEKSGVTDRSNLAGSEPANRRQYLVTLLYNIEEKIEYAVDEGKLSADDAAPVIDSIVEIKEKLLDGAPKSEIRPLLQDLKTDLRELRSSADNTTANE